MVLKEVKDNRKIFKDMGMHKWQETTMRDLKKNMRIRLYSPSGRPLELGGEETFLTESDAYRHNNTWAVKIKLETVAPGFGA